MRGGVRGETCTSGCVSIIRRYIVAAGLCYIGEGEVKNQQFVAYVLPLLTLRFPPPLYRNPLVPTTSAAPRDRGVRRIMFVGSILLQCKMFFRIVRTQ